MEPAPPNTSQPPSGAPSRTSQLALGVLATLAILGLGYRGYGDRFTSRPTEHEPAAVRYAVNLNTADKAELMQVPGVGPNLADAILTHRRERGGFTSIEELSSVKGVGGSTLDKVRPWVRVLESEEPGADRVPELMKLERKSSTPPAPFEAIRIPKIQSGEPPIEINSADAAEFQRLPGIGPTLSQRIVETRNREPFHSVEDLHRVRGIGAKTMKNLRPYVVCR